MNAPLEKKRIGRIFVSTRMYYHHGVNIAETLALIKFLPLRVEHRADMDAFELSGVSNQFELITYGASVPSYELQIRNRKDGTEYVKCSKMKGETDD